MPLHFDDHPRTTAAMPPGTAGPAQGTSQGPSGTAAATASSVPFSPYSFDDRRNQILFRLLARHGTIVASTLEFNTGSIRVSGGVEIKVNALTQRDFNRVRELRNPYQGQSDDGSTSAQPLILGNSAEKARATLQLDRARMVGGPFSQDSFENEYEPFNNRAFRYFVKDPQQWKTYLQWREAPPPSLGSDSPPEILGGLQSKERIQDVEQTVLEHLEAFYAKPDDYPAAWREYATSEARKQHHLHKSFLRMDSHYESLEKHVGTAARNPRQRLTEVRGEYLAAKVMAMVFAGEQLELKMGFGDKQKAQGIDQIWAKRHPDTKEIEAYFIVEAKGSKSAKHGQNKEETQMSPGWIFRKLLEQASAAKEHERIRALARKILGAMFDQGSQVAVYGMTLKAIYDERHRTATAYLFNLQISRPLAFPELLRLANDKSLEIDSAEKLFGTNPFEGTPASQVGILSRVPSTPVRTKTENARLTDVREAIKNLPGPRKFELLDVFHPEHPRNQKLLEFLAAHTTSISSVQDYFGVDPKKVKIGSHGKLTYFSGFASTVYGKNGHQHRKIDTLVDPYHAAPSTPAVVMELEDPAMAKAVLAWKQSNRRADDPEPAWKARLRQLTSSTGTYPTLEFFAMRPAAREELKRIMNNPRIKDKQRALSLAFPRIKPEVKLDDLQKKVTLENEEKPLWRRAAGFKPGMGEGDLFRHHAKKSRTRLGSHYRSLEGTLEGEPAPTKVTEARGEFLGAQAMAIIFGKDKLQLKMRYGEKTGSHGIDQIWVKRDEPTGKVLTYFLVECKGSKQAELGQNLAETQMSPAWICKALFHLAQDTQPRLKSLAQKILQAMLERTGNISVFGVIIQSLYDGENPTGCFNIRITSRLFFPDMLVRANTAHKAPRDQRFDPHTTIPHDALALTSFLPDYGGRSKQRPRGSPLLQGGPPRQPGHYFAPGFPLSEGHREKLDELQLTTGKVASNEDCAYETVIHWLQASPELTLPLRLTAVPSVGALKKMVLEVIQEPDFAKHVLKPSQTPDELAAKVMARSGSDSDIVLAALARALGLDIQVISPIGAAEPLHDSFPLDLPSGAPRVYAVRTTQLEAAAGVPHYYPAVPRAAPTAQQGPANPSPASKPGKKRTFKATQSRGARGAGVVSPESGQSSASKKARHAATTSDASPSNPGPDESTHDEAQPQALHATGAGAKRKHTSGPVPVSKPGLQGMPATSGPVPVSKKPRRDVPATSGPVPVSKKPLQGASTSSSTSGQSTGPSSGQQGTPRRRPGGNPKKGGPGEGNPGQSSRP